MEGIVMKTKSKLFILFVILQVFQFTVLSNVAAQSYSGNNILNKTIISSEKFKGLCYSPYRDNENPDYDIHPSVEEIVEDLTLVKNLTLAVRTYGVTDNLEQIPLLCQQNGIDCYPGAWISKNECENERQTDSLIKIANSGLSYVKGLNVGSEVLLRNDITEQQLIEYINKVKSQTNLPVSTSEIWSTWLEHPKLAEAVDTIYAHIYPFWDGIPIENAANYLLEKWNALRSKYPNKTIILGETGWPSSGKNRGNAVPSAINQKTYLSDFLSVASKNNIGYFIFEIFDEKWKIESVYEIGEHWGIYNSNGSLKLELTELVPEQARTGLARVSRVITSKNAELPLYVYSDRCDARNGFCPSGWMGELATIFENDSTYKDPKQIIDESCNDNPHSGNSCIKISYKPAPGNWGGIYWQFPINNWGNYPGYSFDKTAKVILSFWARGKYGGEKGEFKTGGIYDPNFPYLDSYGSKTTGVVRLETAWKKYSFDLTDQDLSMVIGGFCWVTNDTQNPIGCTIYLDDIVFETFTVSPKPAITDMTTTVCSGVGFTVTPANGTNGVVPAGSTYSWGVPAVTGGLTGGAASIGTPTSISGTLTNQTNTAQTATYTVTPTSGSCSGSTFTVTVTVSPKPKIIAKWGDILICYNLGDLITSFQWYKDGSAILGAIKQYYETKKQPGDYWLETIDKNGCKNSSNTISILGTKSLSVYPNPASVSFALKISDESEGRAVVSIINSAGIKVMEFRTENINDELLKEIPVNNLDEGIYIVHVLLDNKDLYYTKIIVIK